MSPLAISSLVLPTDVFICPPLCAPAQGCTLSGDYTCRAIDCWQPRGGRHEHVRQLDRRRLRHDRAVGAGGGRQQEDPRVRDARRGQLPHPPRGHRRAPAAHRAAHRVRPVEQRVRHQRRGGRLDRAGGRRDVARRLQRLLLRAARGARGGRRAHLQHRPDLDGLLRLAAAGHRPGRRHARRHGGGDGRRRAHLALDGRGRRRRGRAGRRRRARRGRARRRAAGRRGRPRTATRRRTAGRPRAGSPAAAAKARLIGLALLTAAGWGLGPVFIDQAATAYGRADRDDDAAEPGARRAHAGRRAAAAPHAARGAPADAGGAPPRDPAARARGSARGLA